MERGEKAVKVELQRSLWPLVPRGCGKLIQAPTRADATTCEARAAAYSSMLLLLLLVAVMALAFAHTDDMRLRWVN